MKKQKKRDEIDAKKLVMVLKGIIVQLYLHSIISRDTQAHFFDAIDDITPKIEAKK